ncbi:MAG: hypothetical protein EXR07_08705 [Acetobacteraceae bacterium]|nr:hypothetical protein [Acetobacteraceae bacterium]
MVYVILALLLIVTAIVAPRYVPLAVSKPGLNLAVRAVLLTLALFCILGTSIIKVPADQVGVVRKIYGTSSLPEGHIIATNGETGYQAAIIPPGTFRISVMFNIFNEVHYMPIVSIPNGFYGRVVARDGENLREGQIMADPWPDEKFSNFLDAQYFMTNHGQRGLQLSMLKPGTYPINLMLYQVSIGFKANGKDQTTSNDFVYDASGFHKENTPLNTSITAVPAGFVGVVRSSVQLPGTDCKPTKAAVDDADSLSADLVPVNCKGIWAHALPPNDYYLNRDAYDVTLVDTRVQTLEFKGGFKRRAIDLKINASGDFEQTERTPVDIPKAVEAVDVAVYTKVEGWEIPQELRAVVQISPQNAPIIVAAVGGLKEVEDRIMVPSIRSHVRNVYGGNIQITVDGKPVIRQTKVLDTIENRPVLENAILALVQLDGRRAGVDVKEIRLGDSAIPPELLFARQREQLAGQLQKAFEQEKLAQEQRQKVAKARAEADQQTSIVTAQIGVQVAELSQKRRDAEGNAERSYLEQIAKGQKALTLVLGEDRVFMSNVMDKLMSLLEKRPEIAANQKWPQYLFLGGSAWENAAGMLGTSPMLNRLVPPDGTTPPRPQPSK